MKRRILLIARAYPPAIGGMEKYAYDLYRLTRRYVDVDIVANTRGKYFLPLFVVRVVLLLMRSRCYTHVHFSDSSLTFLHVFIPRHVRASCTAHGLDVTFENKIYQFLIRRNLNRFDSVVCVSEYTAQECLRRGVPKERCCVIPNGIVFDSRDSRTKSVPVVLDIISKKKDVHILLSVSRLVHRKGHEWFIRKVMPLLPDEYVFVIAGSGPEQQRIHTAARASSRSVLLLGQITELEKNWLYKQSEWFVMPNIKVKKNPEGFGISIIEAAAAGLPSVCTNVDGIPDAVIVGKTGFLVQAGDARAFKNRIMRKRPLSSVVRSECRISYDWNRIAIRYVGVWTE